jgi:hypothetical protein
VGKVADAVIVIATKDLTAEGFAAVRAELAKLRKETADHTEQSKSLADSIKKYFTEPIDQSKLALGAITALGAGLAAAAVGIVALGSHGADVADVQTHFQRLNEEIGNNAKTMMTTLAAATGHTISNFDLMKSANLALSDGVKLTERDFGTLGRASRTLADVTNGDTKTAFETLLDVMESGRTKALKNIGVTIDQKKALEDYAATLHKTAADLNDHETKVATQNAVLKALEASLKQTGDAQDDFADAVSRGKVFFENFTDDLSVGIANSPVLAAALGGVQQAMDGAFGGDSQGAIKAIVGFIEDGAITLIDFAQVGITVAGGVGRAFAAVQVVFDLVAEASLHLALTAVDAIGGVLQLATKMPTVGDSFKGAAAAAKDMSLQLGGAAKSWHEQATDAAEAVVGNSALQRGLDGLSTGFQNARDAMVHAKDAKHQDAEATDSAAGALKRHGDETERSTGLTKAAAAEAKKHAEEIAKLRLELTGAGIVKGLSDVNEALGKEASNLRQLPLDALTKINNAVEAGIDLYRRRGQAAPEALHIESLAIKAALDEARRAQDEFDKLHGPVTFGKTSGIDLGNIPTAKNADGSIMGNGSLLSGTALGKDMTNALLLGTSNIDTAAVAAAAAKKVKGMIGPGFWKDTFGSPQQLGVALSDAAMGAIQGGGNVLGAVSGTLGGQLGTGVAKSLGGSLLKDGAGLFSKALGGVISSALPVVGSLIGPLATKLWNSLFGSAGRDAVKDFAAKNGGFDALHASLGVLGAEGEKLWINLTQGVGKNNPAEAKKAIDAINDALAHAPTSMADQAANAGFQTTAQLDTVANDAVKLWAFMRDAGTYSASQVQSAWEKAQSALAAAGHDSSATIQTQLDQAKDALKELDDQIASLQKSVDAEAPEEEMGAIERLERAKLDAMKKEREAAAAHVEDLQQQLIDSMNDVANALKNIPTEITIDVKTRFGDGGSDPGDGGRMPGHADGAYIRQDHVARVHAGEIIGPVDFIARAMQTAGGFGGGGDLAIAPLNIDGQKLADIMVRRVPRAVQRYGSR